jgi:electron transport complex protein RnfD
MPLWPILPAAGTTLVILNWLLGGLGVGRIHPVLVTYLLMVALFGASLTPTTVLQRHALFTGDVLDAGDETTIAESKDPWIARPRVGGQDALRMTPATEVLQKFTKGTEESWLSMDALVRDRLPPIQDLILAGQPSGIGTGSVLAVVMGGLFLLYRGLIDWRIPFLIVLGMMAALYVLPVPVVIADHADWSWVAIRDPRVSWATGMTFVHYEMLASPALFMAVFLATDPSVRPMAKGSRAGYALLIGVLTAVLQRYLSVPVGPYLALLIGSLATPFLDKALRPKPIV